MEMLPKWKIRNQIRVSYTFVRDPFFLDKLLVLIRKIQPIFHQNQYLAVFFVFP